MTEGAHEPDPLDLTPLWRQLKHRGPELGLAFNPIKEAFWVARDRIFAPMGMRWMALEPDRLSAPILERTGRRMELGKAMREGDPDTEYDTRIAGWMERTTPQFNLRNVPRKVVDVEPGWIDWEGHTVPDRTGYEKDLAEVRAARHEPPEFLSMYYSSNVSVALRGDLTEVLRLNDWEQWYGEDKKREMGALWRYVPPDGGIRTRPWPELLITAHKYWKGRLITQEY